jgi:hypothetical protein
MGRMTDEQADEWRMERFGGEPARIDEDYFNAEQDAIEAMRAKSDAEYRRVNGVGASAVIAPWNDRFCTWCNGRKEIEGHPCPDCLGTGAECVVMQ